MRSRPEIDVKLPSSVLPGEKFTVELTVTGRSVTPIDFISVDFHATNGTRNPLQNGVFEQHDRTRFHPVNATDLRKWREREREPDLTFAFGCVHNPQSAHVI